MHESTLLIIFTPKKYILQSSQEKSISDIVRISSIIIFHLSKLWKAKFSIVCDVVYLVKMEEKFEYDHF